MAIRRILLGRERFLLVVVLIAGLIGGLIAGMSLGAAPDKTIYSQASNRELKERTLRLAKNIKELVHSYNKKDRELMTDYDKRNSPEIRIDERKMMRQQWLKESDGIHDSFVRQYKEKYWADAILLRDELYRRLPKRMHQPGLAAIYQHPTNVLGVGLIADHLELIAKALPDS
jgi:hypothetical protein